MSAKLFVARLRFSYEASGLTFKEIAYRTGFSNSYIHRLATGQRCNPSIFVVQVLAKVLNVKPCWLAGWSDEQ